MTIIFKLMAISLPFLHSQLSATETDVALSSVPACVSDDAAVGSQRKRTLKFICFHFQNYSHALELSCADTIEP